MRPKTWNNTVCLSLGCERQAAKRGLCLPCYLVCWRLVKAGEATWTEIVARGVARGASVSAVRKAMLRKRAGR